GFRSFFAAMSHLPRSPQDPYGPVVSAVSCYVSMIPGQGAFVVTPSGIEHSRSRTGAQRAQEETDKPRATARSQPGPRPASVPQNDPDRLPALVAARLNTAPHASRQPGERPN